MKRTGVAELPLHSGRAPRWLFQRMVKLAGGITEAVVYEYGSGEFLRRLSEPCWFQAFSCVLGFDWHSSGTTTTTCGALKVALEPEKHGIVVAGGKGKTSRKAPDEIESAGNVFSLPSNKLEKLKYSSKMSAKVDNTCIQDGYQLYHHCFIFTEHGDWAVIQQGMNENYARRYHWLSERIENFVETPHSAICCERKESSVLDMTARESGEARKTSVDLVKDNPEHLKRYFKQRQLTEFLGNKIQELSLPARHAVLDIDVGERGMHMLKKAYELQPENYEELVAIRGIGPKTVRALTLISELVYGSKASWKDPAKYSFAHGGKDGFPYPVDRKTYDASIEILKNAVEEAKVEKKEKYSAIKRLHEFLER
ncbi:MAG: DUF763 domain-containing protein [Methanobacteriota archaeon]